VLNQSAGLALTLAAAGGAENVDTEAAIEALAQLGLKTEDTADDDPAVLAPAKPKPKAPRRRAA
jgi:hypothetical protein